MTGVQTCALPIYTSEGTLHMAHNARGEADLRSREEQWKRRGAPVELLTGAACEQATGTKKIAAALLDRRAGTLNPMAYTSGLANAAVGLGGQLFDHSPVYGIIQTLDGNVLVPLLFSEAVSLHPVAIICRSLPALSCALSVYKRVLVPLCTMADTGSRPHRCY